MILLAFISFIIGVALAGRYCVLVLVVATFAGVAGICVYALTGRMSAPDSLVAGLVFAIGVQSGFLAGALAFDRYLRPVKATPSLRDARPFR